MLVFSSFMQRAGPLVLFCSSSAILSSLPIAGALSISFPPSGTPTAVSSSQMMSWQRDTNDPDGQFVIQKIKLDDPDGPTAKSTPVPVSNSEGNGGNSPMSFVRAGLFQILALDIQNGQTFFSTEVTVLPNPTSSGAPTPSSTSSVTSGNDGQQSGSGSDNKNSTISLGPATPTGSLSVSTTPTSATGINSLKSTSTLRNRMAAIIGGVLGGFIFLFAIAAAILYLRYRKRRTFSATVIATNLLIPDPFIDPPEKETADRVDQPVNRIQPSGPLAIEDPRHANVALDAVEEGRVPRAAQARATTRAVRHEDSGWRHRDTSASTGDEAVEDIPPDYSSV